MADEDGRVEAMAAREAARTPVAARPAGMAWLDMAEADLVALLRNSLFPGAADESIRNVIAYCKAAGLNVMLKPCHIVPMYVRGAEGKSGSYRDVIMPGINHYRTQASRSGEYMGKSLPEWGPMVEYQLDDVKVTVPEYCRITVRRLVQGQIVEFSAEEYWIENYATAGRDKKAPNVMWATRKRGQLGKVTEAQALRMAFPEFTGDATAEEMEGKVIDAGRIDEATGTIPASGVGARQQLDRFAGNGPKAIEKQVEVETDLSRRGPEPEEVARRDAVAAEPKREQAPIPEDDGVVPTMPGDASNAWQVDGKWAKGWKWLNEVMPTVGPLARQALTDDHAELLWAVNDAGAAYKKAAGAFITAMGVTVPERSKKQ